MQLLFTGLIVAVILVCSASSSPRGEITNKLCPVIEGEPVDPNIFVEYEGKRVYLCCMTCRKKFVADPTAYLANLPQFSDAESQDTEHEGEGHSYEAVAEEQGEHGRGETHDHAFSHSEQVAGFSRFVRFIGKFHPVAVHFPIALVLAGAFAELVLILTGRGFFADAARFSVIGSALGATVAVPLGWAAGMFANYPGELSGVLSVHRWVGTAAGVVIVITAVLSELSRARQTTGWIWGYRVALLAAVFLAGVTGHFGGILIYGSGYYKW